MRYQARIFGRPVGPWRAHSSVATDDAIQAGHGSRDWDSGATFTAVGVEIVGDTAPPPAQPEGVALDAAFSWHHRWGGRSITEAASRLALAEQDGDRDEAMAWRDMIGRLKAVQRDCGRPARSKRVVNA